MSAPFEDAAARAYREGRREQRCPDCGREEAGGAYCTGCLRPVHPDDWTAPERSPAQRDATAAARRSRLKESAGQAIVETALALPVLLFLFLAILEAGWLMAEWSRWQGLANALAVSAATTGDLPAWWTAEADRAHCHDAAATLAVADPVTVDLSCRHASIAVSGFAPTVTVRGLAAAPATPAPSVEVMPSTVP